MFHIQGDDGLLLASCQLAMHLANSDLDSNDWIKKADFATALEKFFPNKDEESVTLLLNAADIQLDTLDSDIIPYPDLFSEVISSRELS